MNRRLMLLCLMLISVVGLITYFMSRTIDSGGQLSEPPHVGEVAKESQLGRTPAPAFQPAHLDVTRSPEAKVAPGMLTSLEKLDPVAYPMLVPAFFETRIAKEWLRQGVTVEDIQKATDRLREQGLSGPALLDPGLIGQFLPAREIQPVYIKKVNLPPNALSGVPIPFLVEANFPDPSFIFDRWNVILDGSVIVLEPIGSKSGNPVAAIVVPVDLEGELPGLPPGDYTIRVTGLGTEIEASLSVQ